jgi:uncharacterized protein YeaC (DUF1315 family)
MKKLLDLLNSMTPENMKKLLDLLNSMTPENMKKLLDLLNSMTPENMQKLLDLLNSMTRENMQKLLQLLNSMTPENMELILLALNNQNIIRKDNIVINQTSRIGELLDAHLKLDKESMSKLLDFYSFIEIKKMENSNNRYQLIFHKYKDGKIPFFKKISVGFGNEEKPTCSAISVLGKGLELLAESFRLAFLEQKKNLLENASDTQLEHPWDTKLLESKTKCETQDKTQDKTQRLITGGGRKRRTLKKKRGGKSK